VELDEREVAVRIGTTDPPARATDPKTVRHYVYLDACKEREAERQANRSRSIETLSKDPKETRAGQDAAAAGGVPGVRRGSAALRPVQRGRGGDGRASRGVAA
jgi:hypothetical protein